MIDASTTPAVHNAITEEPPKPHVDYYEAVCLSCGFYVPFSETPRRAQLIAQAGVRCARCRGAIEIRLDIDMRSGSVLMNEGRRD